MGNLKSSSPTSMDTEGMFEDAAYWNRYDQTTPWGGIRWNDDRTSMEQYLSPEMQSLMGMQMSMYGGALGEMMAWFGMDPNAFGAFGAGGGYGDGDGAGDGADYGDGSGADYGDGGYTGGQGGSRDQEGMNFDQKVFREALDLFGAETRDDPNAPIEAVVRGFDVTEEGSALGPGVWSNEPEPGTGTTGGPWNSWGGRQPEMFFAENIPDLISELNWDAIPDLPNLEDFGEDRERITAAMYEQGMGLLDPYLQKMNAKSRQGLADRGIPISAEIGLAERGDFNQFRGKALGDLSFASLMGGYDEAARQFGMGLQSYGTGLQGELARVGVSNQARAQGWNETMGVRGQKWNELASLLGLSQISPQGMGQQGYNFNPNIDVMGGYGLEYQNNQYNAGLFNSFLSDLMGSMSFA